jgi:type IV secretory pathway TraG/TraD family ATPase VirD4
MIAGKRVVLYIDELHLIHNINGVLQRLDEFARIDRSFKSALCLINQNFNSIRSGADLKKKEYYESIFTMSQYNLFFTTGEEDVQFLVEMLSGSGQPLSETERRFMTQAGRGKALLLMTAFDRYQVQFDVDY